MRKCIHSDDGEFDKDVRTLSDWHYICECQLVPLGRGMGRRPMPDGLLVKKRHLCFVEIKRPSECARNSWGATYEKDRIKSYRIEVRKKLDQHKILRHDADAKIVIAEHDEHMSVRGRLWDVPREYQGIKSILRNCFILPTSRNYLGDAIIKELDSTGRNPTEFTSGKARFIVYELRDWNPNGQV